MHNFFRKNNVFPLKIAKSFLTMQRTYREVSFQESNQAGERLVNIIKNNRISEFHDALSTIKKQAKDWPMFRVAQHNLYMALFIAAKYGQPSMLKILVESCTLSVWIINSDKQKLDEVTKCAETISMIQVLKEHEIAKATAAHDAETIHNAGFACS